MRSPPILPHMRLAALLALVLACACARRAPTEADIAAVYEVFLGGSEHPERVLLQDVTVPVSVRMVSDWRPGFERKDEVSREFSAEVREALEDLVEQSRAPRRLAPGVQVTPSDVRISADSARTIFETIRRERLRRLPGRESVVQLSAIGFSRDGTVAAVYENSVCGELCGGATIRIVRRHPGGWLPAESVASVLY